MEKETETEDRIFTFGRGQPLATTAQPIRFSQ